MYEIRQIEWKHSHLSVYTLQKFSHSKNGHSDLKFFPHLPQTPLVGKHEKTEILFTLLTMLVVSFHSGTEVGHTTLFGSLRGFHFFHILKLKSGGYFTAVELKCLVRMLLPGSPKTSAMMPRKVLDVAERCGWSHSIAFD